MAENHEGVLTDVATAIGSTLGAVAGTTDRIKRLVKTEKRVVAKKVRRAKSRVARGRKVAKRKVRAKVRQIRKIAKRR
jgi:hypothetical protein